MFEKRQMDWEELRASPGFRELRCFRKGPSRDVFNLRILPDGDVEVWRVSERGAALSTSSLVGRFSSEDQAIKDLDEVLISLRETGWTEESLK